jgi:hypothetical protein
MPELLLSRRGLASPPPDRIQVDTTNRLPLSFQANDETSVFHIQYASAVQVMLLLFDLRMLCSC